MHTSSGKVRVVEIGECVEVLQNCLRALHLKQKRRWKKLIVDWCNHRDDAEEER